MVAIIPEKTTKSHSSRMERKSFEETIKMVYYLEGSFVKAEATLARI